MTLIVVTPVSDCFAQTDPNISLTVHLRRFTWLSNEPSVSDSVGGRIRISWPAQSYLYQRFAAVLKEVGLEVGVGFIIDVVVASVGAHASKSETFSSIRINRLPFQLGKTETRRASLPRGSSFLC